MVTLGYWAAIFRVSSVDPESRTMTSGNRVRESRVALRFFSLFFVRIVAVIMKVYYHPMEYHKRPKCHQIKKIYILYKKLEKK